MSRYDPLGDHAPRPLGPVVSGGYGRCSCAGPEESCKWCDGSAADEAEWFRAPASWRVAERERVDAWWAGQTDEQGGAA